MYLIEEIINVQLKTPNTINIISISDTGVYLHYLRNCDREYVGV